MKLKFREENDTPVITTSKQDRERFEQSLKMLKYVEKAMDEKNLYWVGEDVITLDELQTAINVLKAFKKNKEIEIS